MSGHSKWHSIKHKKGAADAARGKTLAYTCLGCHGIEGYKNAYPNYSVPKLSGQHTGYLVAALNAYKSGERGHGTMHAQAVSMSDQDMEDIAAAVAFLASDSAGYITGATIPVNGGMYM